MCRRESEVQGTGTAVSQSSTRAASAEERSARIPAVVGSRPALTSPPLDAPTQVRGKRRRRREINGGSVSRRRRRHGGWAPTGAEPGLPAVPRRPPVGDR